MGKDKAKPPARTRQTKGEGQHEARTAAQVSERQAATAHDRVLLAQDRARLLREHFAYLDRVLARLLSEEAALPLEEFPTPFLRGTWLEEQARRFTRMVAQQWEAAHGDAPGNKDVESRARLRLLDAVQEALVQRDTGLVRRALARQELGQTNPEDTKVLENVELEALRRGVGEATADRRERRQETWALWQAPSEEQLAANARRWFAAQHPEYGDRLSDRDWLEAVQAFERGHGERKWEHLADFIRKAGFVGKQPDSLMKEWRLWKSRASQMALFPILDPEQGLLHEERSNAGLVAASDGGSRKSQ
jgi:hypothetical protein